MNAFAVLGLVAFASLIVQLVLMGRSLRRHRARPVSRVELDKYLESMRQYGWEVRRVGDDAYIATYGVSGRERDSAAIDGARVDGLGRASTEISFATLREWVATELRPFNVEVVSCAPYRTADGRSSCRVTGLRHRQDRSVMYRFDLPLGQWPPTLTEDVLVGAREVIYRNSESFKLPSEKSKTGGSP